MKNLTLLSLFKIAVKYIFLIIFIALIFSAVTFSYCRFAATPKYSATGSVLATNGAILSNSEGGGSTLSGSDISASINFVATVSDILETNGIFKQMSETLDHKYSYGNLIGRCTVRQRAGNSMFIDITFTATTEEEARLLVNEYLKLAPNYINEFVPNSATVAITAADTATKVFPKPVTYTLLAAVVGAVLTFCILVLVNSFNTVIQDSEEFEERFNIPVLGVVPNFANAKSDKAYRIYDDLSKGASKSGN